MGNHYVPQRYLENFQCQDRPGYIWLHNKHTKEAGQAGIKAVAQARGFYPPDVETLLNHAVEAPTYPVINKLLIGEGISAAERHQLALYIGTMMMRVPAQRRKLLTQYPDYLADYCKDTRAEIEALADTQPDMRPELRARVLEALDRYERQFGTNPSQGVVREVNRRLASTADRAFHHERAPWLLRLMQKTKLRLSRLAWSDQPRWREPPQTVASGSRYVLEQRRTS